MTDFCFCPFPQVIYPNLRLKVAVTKKKKKFHHLTITTARKNFKHNLLNKQHQKNYTYKCTARETDPQDPRARGPRKPLVGGRSRRQPPLGAPSSSPLRGCAPAPASPRLRGRQRLREPRLARLAAVWPSRSRPPTATERERPRLEAAGRRPAG